MCYEALLATMRMPSPFITVSMDEQVVTGREIYKDGNIAGI
jgi:hypothetical protein